MDALVERLDAKLRNWRPDVAAEARQRINELIEMADSDLLDLGRSRILEQQVLDMLDEPTTR